MPGGRKPASIPTYPEDSLQSAISPSDWWVPDSTHDFKTGVLVRAFIPHVQQIPYVIIPEGREVSTEHTTFKAKIEPLDVKNPHKLSKLPVACLPVYPKEVRAVYRAKKRPAVVVAEQGTKVDDKLTAGKPRWQTAPTLLVAPFYGSEEDGERSGFRPEFIDRVRKGEYPQYMLDRLPLGDGPIASILRFDHIQPVGCHHNSLEHTGWRLSEDALLCLKEWLLWFLDGDMDENTLLATWMKAGLSRV
jgi:hypothetical protein